MSRIYLALVSLVWLSSWDGASGKRLDRSDGAINPLAEYSYTLQPRHVHLAFGAKTTEVVVTWSTKGSDADSIVNWGLDAFLLDQSANGTSSFFEDATKKNVQYIHRVHLANLAPNATYFYQAGGRSGWSSVFGFRTPPQATTAIRFAAYGDLGVVNAKSLTRLQKEAHTGLYDMILHVGDMAYNMNYYSGERGDDFMEQIQPIAGYLPYMTCPGNHERADDFLQYRSRFSMPNYGATEGIYYSFDVGPVHFVSISSEVYDYGEHKLRDVIRQWVWLSRDLQEANKPENRAERPWVVIYGHKPMYCSNADKDDCTNVNTKTRVGVPIAGQLRFGIEDLLLEHHVDLAFWAHEHSYERFYPIYNYTYHTQGDPYVHPKAPVHVVTGSAGCYSQHDPFTKQQPPYTAKRFLDYGYTRVSVLNTTHLHLQQVKAEDGAVLDEVMIVRHEGDWRV